MSIVVLDWLLMWSRKSEISHQVNCQLRHHQAICLNYHSWWWHSQLGCDRYCSFSPWLTTMATFDPQVYRQLRGQWTKYWASTPSLCRREMENCSWGIWWSLFWGICFTHISYIDACALEIKLLMWKPVAGFRRIFCIRFSDSIWGNS